MNQNLFFTDTAWGTKIDVSGENLDTTYNPFTSANFNVPSDSLIRFEFGPNIGYGYVVGVDKRIYNPIVNGTIQQAFLTIDDVDEISKTLTDEEISDYVKVTGIAVTANTLSESQINEADDPTEGGEWVKVEEADDPTEGGEWVKVEEADDPTEGGEWVKVEEDEDTYPSRVTESHRRFHESRDIFSRLKESNNIFPRLKESRNRVNESRLLNIFNRLQESNAINESRNVSVITFDEFCKELAVAFPDDNDVKNLHISGFSKVTFATTKGTVNARMVEGMFTFVAFENKNNKLIAFGEDEFKELLQTTEFVKVHK